MQSLDPLQKLACILMRMPPHVAAPILKQLTPDDVRRIMETIKGMKTLTEDEARQTIAELIALTGTGLPPTPESLADLYGREPFRLVSTLRRFYLPPRVEPDELDPLRKAATILISLSPQLTATIFVDLPTSTVTLLTGAIGAIPKLSRAELRPILAEMFTLLGAAEPPEPEALEDLYYRDPKRFVATLKRHYLP